MVSSSSVPARVKVKNLVNGFRLYYTLPKNATQNDRYPNWENTKGLPFPHAQA